MIHENTLGELIEKNRIARNISKSKLCRGLCSVTALTRYEQDVRIPGKMLVDALLERLGIKPYQFEFILSDEEFQQSMLRNKIEDAIWNDLLKTARENLAEYRKNIKSCPMLHQQFVLSKEGEIAKKEHQINTAVKKFQQALECTGVEKVLEAESMDVLFSKAEIDIIYHLAECLYFTGEIEHSYIMFEKLKKYIEEVCWDDEKRLTYYPHILYRISEYAYQKCNFGIAESLLAEARNEMIQEFQLSELYEIMCLLKKVREKNRRLFTSEEQEFLTAMEIIKLGNYGEITDQGVELWQSTVSQQL